MAKGRLAIGAAPRRRPKLGPVLRGVLLTLGLGLIIARLFFVQLVVVRGNTMAPNVLDGDVLLVLNRDRPRRGDVILVSLDGQTVLRRILGLPGEQISARGGLLLRDGVPLATQVTGVFAWRSFGPEGEERPHRQQALTESIGEDRSHAILGDYAGAPLPWSLEVPTLEIPPDQLFVLCDNRRLCPADERAGLIPRGSVKGVARSLLWYGDARAETPPRRPVYGAFVGLSSARETGDPAPGRR